MRVIALILMMLTLCGASALAHPGGDTPPPGAIRWDTYDVEALRPAKQASTPPTYQFGHALAECRDIGVDDAGRLYVMDGGRRIIARFGLQGKQDALWLDEPTGTSQKWDMMYHIAPLPDDRLYLICQRQDKVFRLGPGGDVTVLPGVAGAGEIAATPDGGYALHRYDYSGKESALKVFSPDGSVQAEWKTPCFKSITVSPDGLIYGTAVDDMRIYIYDLQGNLKREINVGILPLSSNASSYYMESIQVDSNGDIYVKHGGIIRLDRDGKPIARWGTYWDHETPARPASIRDLAVRNGIIYGLVYDANSFAEIQAFSPDGQCIARYQRTKPALELPGDVAIQADGSYAVTQSSVVNTPNGVLMFDAGGTQIGSADAAPHIPSIAARDGKYYLAESYFLDRVDRDGTNRARIVDLDTKFLIDLVAVNPQTDDVWAFFFGKVTVVGKDDQVSRRFELQFDVKPYPLINDAVITRDGVIYSCDSSHHRIIKYDFNGKSLGTFGSEGSGMGEFRWPSALTVDRDGRVIVADMGNSRIQAFAGDGTPLGIWGRYGRGDGELNRPGGLAVSPDNTLFIADTHNDRIVKVPLASFWQQLTKEIKPGPAYVAPKKEPVPTPGEVTVEGIVIAGTDDFTDVIYLEAADRSWGARVTLPTGTEARRGDRVQVTGILKLEEHAAKHIIAKQLVHLPETQDVPDPLGMANLYVGDGYKPADKLLDSSNLGLLIKTWGKVVSVDLEHTRFKIADSSEFGDESGLEVYGGQLVTPIENWPKVGQYVGVTGVSAIRPIAEKMFQPAIRIRCQEDLDVMAEK